jgi:hypothetical protein
MRKVTVSFLIFLNKSASTGRIFMKFNVWALFKNLSKKFNFQYSLTGLTGTSLEDAYTSMTLSCQIFLRMENVSEKM